MIGWATSLFPQEIPEALGLCIVYPENHSAGLAAQKATAPFLDYAEGVLGCNNDLCSYAKINLAYAELLECPGNNMPVPDFLLVANNGCAETTKWFELLSRKWNIPLFMIDLTYNHFEGVNEARCKYIAAQLRKLIDDLCKLTGKTWDEDKFIEVQKISARNRELWDAVCDSYADVPAPLGGFDLFNYMGSMVFTRGKKETADVFEQLLLEIDEHRKNGTSTFGKKEEFRIFLGRYRLTSHIFLTMQKHWQNMVLMSFLHLMAKPGLWIMKLVILKTWHALTVLLPAIIFLLMKPLSVVSNGLKNIILMAISIMLIVPARLCLVSSRKLCVV